MAAPKIRLRRSATSGNAPTTTQIDLGEVAINTHDGKLFLKRDQSGTERIVDVTAFQETGEPNGHQDRTQSTISFNNTNRVFTIAPVTTRFDVWCKGIRFAFTSAQTTEIPNTTGLYYVYFDQNGVLQNKASATAEFSWKDETPVAILFWNALTGAAGAAPFVYDTRHGITLDWQTHEYLQKTRGAAVYEGFNLLYYSENQDGSLDSHAQIGMAGGTFFNEDLEVTIVASSTPTNNFEQNIGNTSNPGVIPVIYRSGKDTGTTPPTEGPWVIDTATTFPFKNVTNGRMVYNSSTLDGVWSTTEITNNYYGVMYIVATSDPNIPIVSFMGQDEYATLTEAKGVSWATYNFGNFPDPDQTPTSDMRLLYKLIYQVSDSYTNTRKARLIEFDDKRLTNFINLVGGREAVITDHGILSGLADDDHLQYVHTTLDRTISADHTIDTTGSIRFNGSLLDNTGSAGTTDYALISKDVGGVQTVAWGYAPSAPETNILYVSKDGNDANDGLTLGTSKLTIKNAVENASAGTVVRVYAGVYSENNPIIMPKQTSIVGSSLREVSVTPANTGDLFYVNNGCYISDMSFVGSSNTGAIVAFNPNDPPYIDQSPYIQNCTNFIPSSTGLKINGNDCIGNIKSMVVDSFTQFNPDGFGATISNEAYAQLVSMFTICTDTAILCEDGGGCDLTNSNSSFGLNGLIADGVSPLKYTGSVAQAASAADTTVRINISTTRQIIVDVQYNNTAGTATITTAGAHPFAVGNDVKLENVLMSCNSGNHTFISATENAVTNTTGGGSTVIGPVTAADYDSTTGVFIITIANHGLSAGDTIQLATNSFTFTCDQDNNQTQETRPAATDPYAGIDITVDAVTANTITVNVGGYGPITQLFPSGNYGYTFKITDVPSANQFTCTVGTNNLTHTYLPANHIFQSSNPNSVEVTVSADSSPVVGTTYTPTLVTYDGATGVAVFTITGHGLQTNDQVLLATESLNFKCSSDNYTDTFSYPRAGDPAAGVSLVVTTIDADTFSVNVGTSLASGYATLDIIRPYAGQVVYFDTLYYEVVRINITNGGSGYVPDNPPAVTIGASPETWGIDASGVAIVSNTGVVTAVDVVSSGRGYGSTPPSVTIAPPTTGTQATATVELIPSYFIVESTNNTATPDVYDVTFANELPINLAVSDTAYFFRQSRLLASSHSFEYIGSGVNINTALPQTGGIPTPEKETISKNGGLVVYTSTNESGNFKIGDGVEINQALGRISGTSYSQSLFATVTPFILALGA